MLNWYSVFLDEEDFPTTPMHNMQAANILEHMTTFRAVLDELRTRNKCAAFSEVLDELRTLNKRKTGPKSRRCRKRQEPFMYETLMNRLDSSVPFIPKLVVVGCLLVVCALTNTLFVVGAVNAYSTLTAVPEQTFSFSTKTIVNESGVFIEESGEDLTLSVLVQHYKHKLEEQKNFHDAMTSFGNTVVKKAVKYVENLENERKMTKKKV